MMLDRIIEKKKTEIEDAKRLKPLELMEKEFEGLGNTREFFGSLKPDGRVKIIAEIKRASPSKGILREDFDPVDIARGYAMGGASAISVLTDMTFFKGSLDQLSDVRNAVSVPLLRKDFILDPYQVYEARLYGADAILLIVSALESQTLKHLIELAHSLRMDAVVEVHNEVELETAISAGSRLIGINNRDLKTFEVNLEVSARLAKLIPNDRIAISESGISSSGDIKRLRDYGLSVFLIGETFVKSADPGRELRNILLDCN